MKPGAVFGLAVVGLLALAAGLGTAWWLQQGEAVERRPDITLAGLDGRRHAISEWDGKLLLVNFWATWCAPCLKEIPMLVEAQDRYAARGLQIVGIAMDQAEPARAFAERLKMNYPVLVGEAEVAAAMDAFGDTLGALPLSVLVAPDGRILERVAGALDRNDLDELITAHLAPPAS